MKRQFILFSAAKRHTIALMGALLITGASVSVNAQTTEPIPTPYVNYIGVKNDLAAFQVHFDNTKGKDFVLELVNANGDILYSKKFDTPVLHKQILLKNVSDDPKYRVSFIIRAGKNVFNQAFDIDAKRTLIDETVVTRL